MRVDAVIDNLRHLDSLLKRAAQKERVLNAVWFGPARSAESCLASLVGLEGGRTWWRQPSDAVVHFPGDSGAPVIQALNILRNTDSNDLHLRMK